MSNDGLRRERYFEKSWRTDSLCSAVQFGSSSATPLAPPLRFVLHVLTSESNRKRLSDLLSSASADTELWLISNGSRNCARPAKSCDSALEECVPQRAEWYVAAGGNRRSGLRRFAASRVPLQSFRAASYRCQFDVQRRLPEFEIVPVFEIARSPLRSLYLSHVGG